MIQPSTSSPQQAIPTRSRCTLLGATLLLLASASFANEQVEKGRYLVTAADCQACHTAEDGEPFAGGHSIVSPFGTLVTPNITPHAETGIGDWDLAQFRRVLHQGVNDEGDYMYPAMPYRFFTRILDEDVEAIWAYMQSLEPVENEVPEHDMSFPANLRMGLGVWQELNIDPGRFEPEADRDETYNRGKYLVEALAHCSACHSPRNAMMGIEEEAAFTGAVVDDWYAPNISSGSLSVIADWSIDELTEYLRTGKNDSNAKAVGEMSTVIHSSLARLEKADVRAIATYLKTMPEPEVEPQADASEANQMDEEDLTAGRAIYADNCLSCHQPRGKGIDDSVPALAGTSVVSAQKPNNAILLVLQGHAVEDDSWGAMPSFAELLTNGEIADVVNYVRTAWSEDGTADASAELVSELRAGAEIPEENATTGVFCPVASGDVMEAAVDIEAERIEGVTRESGSLENLVTEVRNASEAAPDREIIAALSTRYCQVLADSGDIGVAELNARVAEFSGRVAAAVAN